MNEMITAGPASGTAEDKHEEDAGADRGADAEHHQLEGADRSARAGGRAGRRSVSCGTGRPPRRVTADSTLMQTPISQGSATLTLAAVCLRQT